jgi:hypothetical protein
VGKDSERNCENSESSLRSRILGNRLSTGDNKENSVFWADVGPFGQFSLFLVF